MTGTPITPGAEADTPIRFAVLTASDRCAAGEAQDTSGPAVRSMMESRLGGECVEAAVLPDDETRLSAKLRAWCDGARGEAPDLVLTVGGTGLGPRDVTPEATRAILEREHPGIAELMRAHGIQKTALAALARGVAGTRRRTLIINLPGSERGASESLEALLDVLGHAVRMVRGGDHSG